MDEKQKRDAFRVYCKQQELYGTELAYGFWLDGYSTGHDVATADFTKDQDLKIVDAFHEGEVEGRKN